uniref:Non-specific protein-tyrosine kinase n=1 Tax=Globodera rostochiensis TaxID=31243 RepID=A0A914HDW3_GLORO
MISNRWRWMLGAALNNPESPFLHCLWFRTFLLATRAGWRHTFTSCPSKCLLRDGHRLSSSHTHVRPRKGVRYLCNGTLKVYYLSGSGGGQHLLSAVMLGSLVWLRRIFIREQVQIVHCHSTFSTMAHKALLPMPGQSVPAFAPCSRTIRCSAALRESQRGADEQIYASLFVGQCGPADLCLAYKIFLFSSTYDFWWSKSTTGVPRSVWCKSTTTVPRRWRSTMTDLWAMPYYHGLLDNQDIEELLTQEGDFAVVKKTPENGAELYAIAVRTQEEVTYQLFMERNGRIGIDFKKHHNGFETIPKFIEGQLRSGVSICSDRFVVLRNGVQRQKWELRNADVVRSTQELGRGAFGVVVKGTFTDPDTQRIVHVAIKEILPGATKQQRQELIKEARIMKHFDHRNIIKYYGVTACEQQPLVIVLELATEGSLATYLKKIKHSVRTKLFMLLGAASGLEHIHQKGIIHADVSARNCLYSGRLVKISDFGLAVKGREKYVKEGEQVPIKWMAPEAIRHRAFTQKTDVWAFGVLSWEVFSDGASPFHGVQQASVVEKILGGERLIFPEQAPSVFAAFVGENIWQDEHNKRLSMGAVFDWLDRHINKMA